MIPRRNRPWMTSSMRPMSKAAIRSACRLCVAQDQPAGERHAPPHAVAQEQDEQPKGDGYGDRGRRRRREEAGGDGQVPAMPPHHVGEEPRRALENENAAWIDQPDLERLLLQRDRTDHHDQEEVRQPDGAKYGADGPADRPLYRHAAVLVDDPADDRDEDQRGSKADAEREERQEQQQAQGLDGVQDHLPAIDETRGEIALAEGPHLDVLVAADQRLEEGEVVAGGLRVGAHSAGSMAAGRAGRLERDSLGPLST